VQLKKIINQIVSELSSHGLKPALLHELIDSSSDTKEGPEHLDTLSEKDDPIEQSDDSSSSAIKISHPKVIYELNASSGKIEPRLRIWISTPTGGVSFPQVAKGPGDLVSLSEDSNEPTDEDSDLGAHTQLLWSFQQMHFGGENGHPKEEVHEAVDVDSENGR